MKMKGYNYRPYKFVTNLVKTQPRSQSSSAISNLTSHVKLFGRSRVIALVSKPPLLTQIARTVIGTRLVKTASSFLPLFSAVAQRGMGRVRVGAKIAW